MRPTIKEIADGISWVLDERIAPIVDDKWAASYLRSIKGLLRHISVRSELEAEILWASITEQRDLLGDVVHLETDQPIWLHLIESIREALDTPWFDPTRYRSVPDMEAENLRYRELISCLVETLHEHADGLDAAIAIPLHERTVKCLRRLMMGERPLYEEPFARRPF